MLGMISKAFKVFTSQKVREYKERFIGNRKQNLFFCDSFHLKHRFFWIIKMLKNLCANKHVKR